MIDVLCGCSSLISALPSSSTNWIIIGAKGSIAKKPDNFPWSIFSLPPPSLLPKIRQTSPGENPPKFFWPKARKAKY